MEDEHEALPLLASGAQEGGSAANTVGVLREADKLGDGGGIGGLLAGAGIVVLFGDLFDRRVPEFGTDHRRRGLLRTCRDHVGSIRTGARRGQDRRHSPAVILASVEPSPRGGATRFD